MSQAIQAKADAQGNQGNQGNQVEGFLPLEKARELLRDFLAGRTLNTLDAYRRDLGRFRAFLGANSAEEAARALLSKGPGEANLLVLRFRTSLQEEGLSPASINRKLATLRSMVRMARLVGLVSWTLEVEGLPTKAYRDTRGPGLEGVQKLLSFILTREEEPFRSRDFALVRLLFDLALRTIEVARLEIGDVDFAKRTLAVWGKGRHQEEKEILSLPPSTLEALARWVEVRGSRPGALFGLRRESVSRIIRRLGRRAGLSRVWAHGLRHAGITTALDVSRGDVRAVQRFSRHADLRTLQVYDDNRADLAGAVARQVSERASLDSPGREGRMGAKDSKNIFGDLYSLRILPGPFQDGPSGNPFLSWKNPAFRWGQGGDPCGQ